MRRLTTVALLLTTLAAAGCGSGDQAAAVRGTLTRFAQATARQDYRTLCRQILAPSLIRNVEQIGLPCEIALSRGLGSVRQPKLVVRSVKVSGDRATASVHTSAANQAPLDGTVELQRLGGRWRVASLGAPGR
jgi:hypothetical protein